VTEYECDLTAERLDRDEADGECAVDCGGRFVSEPVKAR